MLYFTCTMISSVDFACYGVSHAEDLVYVDCGTIHNVMTIGGDRLVQVTSLNDI